jgi:predicted component of type VI protein secretion system
VAGADLMREMKAKDQALDTAKSKERWLRYELGRALKAGYMVEDMTEGKKEDFDTLGEDGSELRLLAEGLMKLKKEKSRLQVSGQSRSLLYSFDSLTC